MDELDAAIFREMNRERAYFWGGLDPRVGTSEIARRVGVNRTTVWARLKAWQEDGFLVRQEVGPNPMLFGAGVAGGSLRVDDVASKEAVIAAMALVDGVLCWIDHVGEWIGLGYANESRLALDRCTRLLAELPGVAEVTPCVPYRAPESTIRPTARDWRILAALRSPPGRPLDEVAADAGVSGRTLARRYAQLLEARALWSFPVVDFTRYRGAAMARFVVTLAAGADTRALTRAAAKEVPGLVMAEALDQLVPTNPAVRPWVDIYCHLAAPGEAESVHAWLAARPQVEAVETFFPKAWGVVSSWFEERIERALKQADGSRAPLGHHER